MTTATTSPHVCPHQFAFFLDNWIRRWLQRPARIVGEYIQTGDTVLDIGCGPGFFTLDMARMVGAEGRVYAIDLQAAMLTRVGRKAARKGYDDRIHLHHCPSDRIELEVQADFALAYYMIHETPSVEAFLYEAYQMVRPGGRLLAVEPPMHVNRTDFEEMCRLGQPLGWEIADFPTKKGGHAALFQRPN